MRIPFACSFCPLHTLPEMTPIAAHALCSLAPFILAASVLQLHQSLAAAQVDRNVSLGSFLTTQGNTSWFSPSGDFTFGFLPSTPGSADNFLLAVWFAKIPERTPVWFLRMKGAPPLLQIGSRVDFRSDGLLVLTDHRGMMVWTATNAVAEHAALLDTGNFVLVRSAVSSNQGFLWQSFTNPTDTILPTQELPLVTDLVARLTDTDYSNGRFKLAVQVDGNLVLYPISLPHGDQYRAYWSSNTIGNGSRLIFDNSGTIYMATQNGSVALNITSGDVLTSEFYQRATIASDGVFGHYRYPKNATAGQGRWSPYKLLPENICINILSNNGSGACGYNAYCTLVNQRPRCSCPEGYSFVDPDREYKGCKPNFPPQSCSGTDVDRFGYEMFQIEHLDWPLADYEHFIGIDEDACRIGCMDDCFCAVAIYGSEQECWRKKLPLSNGKAASDQNRKALIKISSNISLAGVPTNQPTNRNTSNPGISILLGSVLIGGLLVIILTLVILLLTLFLRDPQRTIAIFKHQQQRQSNLSMLESSIRCFTYEELEKATEGFKEELGRGAFGIVYKGAFPTDIQIAVKKLDKFQLKDQDAEKEFMTEVKAVGRTHHRNLVCLLGYCNEGSHRLLVYEFMSNGSLMKLLFDDNCDVPPPTWAQRMSLACGVARGLLYLHEECTTQIIHCDIKPQNVLLDEHLNAKISDFGMAKLLKTDQTRTATGIRGTKGYVAPEWFKLVPISAKVDVYSFGVMLLEIVCRRRVVELVFGPDGEELGAEILTDWAYDCYREEKLDLLVANDEEAMVDVNQVVRFAKIAFWCIQEDPALRPSMKKVNQMLEGAIEVSDPPDPSFYSTQ